MPETVNNSFSLRDFYDVLFRHKALILILLFSMLLGTIVGVYVWPETYEAKAGILVKVGRENVGLPVVAPATSSQQTLVSSLGLRKEDINSEIEILRSTSITERVIGELGIDFLFPEAGRPAAFFKRIKYELVVAVRKVKGFVNEVLYKIDLKKRLSVHDRTLLALEERLSARQIKNSDVIGVCFRWKDPDIAKKVVETSINFYLEHHLEAHRTSGGYEFFQRQVEILEKRLKDSEDKLRALKERQEISSYEYQRDLLLAQIDDFKASLKNTQTELAETKRRISELKKQLSLESENIQVERELKRNPVIDPLKTRLLELELEEKRLAERYMEQSRPMVSIREEIEKVKEELAGEDPNVLETTKTGLNLVYRDTKKGLLLEEVRFEALTDKKEMLEGHIGSYLKELEKLNAYDLELKRLNRQIQIDEQNYQLYRRKLEEARISDVLDAERIVNVRVIDSPTASARPVRPRKLLMIGLGIVLSLIVSMGSAFVSDYFDHSIRTAEDVKRYLGLRLLASLQEVKK